MMENSSYVKQMSGFTVLFNTELRGISTKRIYTGYVRLNKLINILPVIIICV